MNILHWIQHWFYIKRYVRSIVKTFKNTKCVYHVHATYQYNHVSIKVWTVHAPGGEYYVYNLPYHSIEHLAYFASLSASHLHNQINSFKSSYLNFCENRQSTSGIIEDYCKEPKTEK